MIRRIGAVVILAILWALGWSALGALLGVYQYYRGGDYAIIDPPVWAGPFWTLIILFALNWAKGGAVGGALFAIVLSRAERSKSIAHLRIGRVAIWGVVGALLVPGTMTVVALAQYGIPGWFIVPYLAITGIAGGLSAAATLLIARSAPTNASNAAA